MRRLLACARVSFAAALVYRSDFLLTIVLVLLQVYLLRVVWTAVYAGRPIVDGVPIETMISYATLAALQYTLIAPLRPSLIPSRVRRGQVAMDLLRPVGFLPQVIAGQVGASAALAPLLLLALPLAVLLGGATRPASLTAALVYPFSLIFAYGVQTLLGSLLGIVAFWTLEVTGLTMIFRVVAQFLSGALIPLWFLPGTLRNIAEVLPFQSTTYTPVAAYLGQLTGAALAQSIAVQVLWLGLLWIALQIAWSRAIRRIVIQGG